MSASRRRPGHGSLRDASSSTTRLLKTVVLLGIALVLLTPFVVTPATAHPYSVGKAIYAHVLVEILVLAWAALAWLDPTRRPQKSWVLAALGLYVLVGFVTAFAGVGPTHSIWSDYLRMGGVWDRAHWAAFALVIAATIRSSRDSRRLLLGMVVVGFTLSMLAIGQAYGFRPLSILRAGCRVDATIGNPGVLAAVLLPPTFIAAGLLADSWAGWKAGPNNGKHGSFPLRVAFYAATIMAAAMVLLLTGTRGAALALLAGVAAGPIASFLINRRSLVIVTKVSVLVFVCVTVVFLADALVGLHTTPCQEETTSVRLIQTPSATRSTMGIRLELAELAIHAFRERPLLGWGPENFQVPFNRLSDATMYRFGFDYQDRAHNQVLEELVAGGILGIVAYGFFWSAILWAGARVARRDQGALPLFVLAALVGFFVQDLFIFDSPVTLLSLSLLAGWLAAQGRPHVEAGPAAPGRDRSSRSYGRPSKGEGFSRPSRPWIPVGMGVLGVSTVVLATYAFSYRPFAAAQALRAFQSTPNAVESLAQAERAIDLFPALGNVPREYAFARLTSDWVALTSEEQRRAVAFVERELENGLREEPSNARLLMGGLPLLQLTASTPQRLEDLDPLLRRLQELAPFRVQTHQRLAVQRLLYGDWTGAQAIADRFVSQAPQTEERFRAIRTAAECKGQCTGAAP